ncbi:tetratricopeptide (TPR) repeat protein [Lewinella marina]|uniref:RagB/SusD family nutrient uptake outer membrane protein n=1 Tax=Neolewinella marina TaxID=438751 RepID=A0A2G0CBJ8_9BACT|nr:RagB/SusD family nutrient uptake outer membrane protein [Neolewinella marina]NJB87113.1 tetratricopeptide (TPR) repeat protein [Neolewinella marina]PHK97358.1 RagB/SusD family nutrient uptake outer membrane protein [Neolewinella marina]
MKPLYAILAALLLTSACEKLDQAPPNIASSNSLTDFAGVLNAAYYYQLGSVTPMAVMGDFRADNAIMLEPPYTEFDLFGPNLTSMEDQFFGPFYTALYKSILSANNVIENSDSENQVGEAKFLRALSYFKLVRVFGDVPVVLTASPSVTDESILVRQPAAAIYDNVIIPDLEDAIAALDNSRLNVGRASQLAAQALLGKVYVQLGDYQSAEAPLANAINGAAEAGVALQADYADIFGVDNDLNSEVIFATQISSSITDEYGFSEFWSWYGGLDTKSLQPLDPDLIEAFGGVNTPDLRFPVVIDTSTLTSSAKYPQTGGPDHDWIEIRLADVILLYAETLNELGASPEEVLDLLDPIRTRAGLDPLDHTVLNTQALVRQAIQDERRLELAFEGQRWFDLVRTGTVSEEMGQSVNPDFYLFPIPVSEVLASFGVITQNNGY